MNNFYPPIQKTIKINQFRIVDVKIELFTKALFTVLLYDVDNNLCESRFYELTEEEYKQYGTDDNYLIKIAKERLQQES